MVFQYNHKTLALITDHIPVKDIPQLIDSSVIITKIEMCLKSFPEIKDVYIAGINPHGGEQGLLGSEDQCIEDAVKELQKLYPEIMFSGPLAGDSFFIDPEDNKLYVSMFHDQGLSAFKAKYRYYGSHLTLGLPFKRFSVDHGTAFNLFGENKADYMGCLLVLKQILK